MAAAPERFAADLGPGHGSPDPHALALAGALQDRLPDAQVILFGSRASGNWTAGSDVDLAVIGSDRAAAEDALAQLQTVGRPSDPAGAELFHFTRVEFDRCRVSLPHLAGQVQCHGLKPNGEPLPPMEQNDTWEGVRDLLQAGRRYLKYALVAFGSNEAEGNAVMAAHNALERCIKAALGAVGTDVFAIVKRNADRYRLTVLADLLPAEPRARLFAAAPPPHLRQLDTYHRTSRYGRDTQVEWPAIPTETLLASARQACLAMADHALAATGKTPREIGYGEHVGDDALGGFGSLPLDHYARRKLSDRERQQLRREALDAERIDALRTLLGNTLTASQLADVEAQWHKFGAPADAVSLIARVMAAPRAWRTLLSGPDGG